MIDDTNAASWPATTARKEDGDQFRLVALDIDGVVQPDGTFHAADAAAIRAAHASAVKIVLVSARSPQAIHRYWAQLGLGVPVIAFNGALVYDFPGHKPVSGQPLPADVVGAALQRVRQVVPTAAVGLDMHDSWAVNRLGPAARALIVQTGTWPSTVGNLRACLQEPIYQLWIDAEADLLDQLATELDQPGLALMRYSSPDRLLLRSASASRGWALSMLAGELEVPPDRVMAVGAGGQDRTLLQAAAFAVITGDVDSPADLLAGEEGRVIMTKGIPEALEPLIIQVQPPRSSPIVPVPPEENEDSWLASEP
jgi:hydroxymethylpyrimidine pyrophosphatase-like HAD family hydrolase